MKKKLEIVGAREHNLQNINLTIPRNQLVVFTGLSGSGKSSLAFDTIYAEGQRRYMETFSSYARHFIGNIERPDVDHINGLSPVISIEQKTTNKNPRSTVGTITEIYDFIRLLYARASDAYSCVSGKRMVKYTESQITDIIQTEYNNKEIVVLAPLVKRRKGHYRELFADIARKGFLRMRVDGTIKDLTVNMEVDRYKIHDIELVVDHFIVSEKNLRRLSEAAKIAFKQGKGMLMVMEVSHHNGMKLEEVGAPRYFSKELMDPESNISYPEPEPNTFSFNSPYGACPKCNGLGEIAEIDINKLVPDPSKSIKKGGFEILGKYSESNYFYKRLESLSIRYGFTLDEPISNFSDEVMNLILYGSSDYSGNSHIPEQNTGFMGIVNYVLEMASEESPAGLQKWANSFMNTTVCPECQGRRLRTESLCFRIDGKNIGEVAEMDIVELTQWVADLESRIGADKRAIAHEILREIKNRLKFLNDVGLGYLSLNRSTRTLSGGESQRIRLATQIGAQLTNVLYILDEPSIGLHQRDNRRLIEALQRLRDIGNSVIVVEHDRDMMLNADYLVDIGPKAGVHGGKIVFNGTREELLSGKNHTLTLDYLTRKCDIPIPQRRPIEECRHLILEGASGNNLKDVTLDIPLGRMVCITGVSGSGKSSLINETLHPILNKHFFRSQKQPLPYRSITGIEHLDKVIEINQSPIGRTPRSNPITYVGIFDDIRQIFAQLPSSRIRGYKPGRFSFNVSGGRCEHCKGAGLRTIEMNFLPDVFVKCEVCNGKRYNRETLEIRYKGKSISDILDMTVDEAVGFFESHPKIHRVIKTLQDVGLGYLTLGQQSTTLSGGEAQRVKLATELSKSDTGNTLYILDEPTTGLHFEDIKILLEVLQKLVDKGNSIVIIEHNLDVIKVADWVIDMGPEGGKAGGQIMYEGTPEALAQQPNNDTAKFLSEELNATAKHTPSI